MDSGLRIGVNVGMIVPYPEGQIMPVLRWIGRHPILMIFVALVAAPLGWGLHWWFLPTRPSLSADDVESIEIHLLPYADKAFPKENAQEEIRITTTDALQIQELLDVFKNAQRAGEHKCGSSGTITIHTKSGTAQELRILPGHDPGFYEYRYGSRINHVDREPFVAALKSLGVQQIKLAAP